jgi:putative ABC transport system substrate-binding protein
MFTRILIITLLTLGLLFQAANAQQTKKIPRVGFLAPQGRSLPLFDAFKQGLADRGYIDGQNIIIEPRFAEGHYERFPDLLAELVAAKVDVVAVTGAVTARAAEKAITAIPIVFSIVVDPVADKVVTNLDRPGGNVTGVTCFDPQQATKQLELLRQVIPRLKRVAVLGDQGVSAALITAAEEQARALGLQPQSLRVAGPNPDLEGAFASMKQQHAEAVLVLEEPVLGVYANKIAELAARDRLPSLFAPSRVGAGGLISYGTSQTEAIRHMTGYIDKVLKGANPGTLPVEKVTRYELTVNLKASRDIAVTVPSDVLKRADRVVQ